MTYFLTHWGVMVVLYKYNVRGVICSISQKFKSRFGKFLHLLSECEFCIEHHVGVLVALVMIIVFFRSWLLIQVIYPFMSAALMNIIKTVRL